MFTYLLPLYRVVGIVLCIYANFHCYYGPVIGILKIDCLRLFVVVYKLVVLLVMCCMCIPVFIVTSADISQLWVYLYCLRLVVVVYKLVMCMERG